MKALVIRDYNYPFSNHIAELQLLGGLQKKGVDITYIGTAKEENLNFLKEHKIKVVENFPKINSDSNFETTLSSYILKNNFDILHLFISKQIRATLPVVKKIPIKVVLYYGSFSLHWHDPSAYLTFLNPRVDAIICNSEHVHMHVKKQLFGNRKNKAVKIYKGYSEKWFSNIKSFDYRVLDIPKEAIIVGIVARNSKVKGVKYFIQAAGQLAHHKNVHFILIGGDTNSANVKKSIANFKNKENIHLLGHRNDVLPLLKGMDIYTQTSLSEGLGRAISEAMCFGKPIVMTNAGGCTELIEDGKSGFITKKKNGNSIANALEILIKNSELRTQMGEQAKKRISHHFNIENTINDTFKLYNYLTNN